MQFFASLPSGKRQAWQLGGEWRQIWKALAHGGERMGAYGSCSAKVRALIEEPTEIGTCQSSTEERIEYSVYFTPYYLPV